MSGGDAERLAERLAFYLLKKVNKVIRDHQLIDEGDRVAVAVSGGKDSLSLLWLLHLRRRKALERYDLVALHVRDERDEAAPQHTQSFGPDKLPAWLRQEGIEYHLLEMDIAEDEPRPLSCFRCSWHRRKALFQAAHALGCRKLALGHHADDAAHTALLNLFYHGRLETMAPRHVFFDGQIVVIRPLIHVPEKELLRLARACGFPTSPGYCPRGADSRRQKMRELLQAVQRDMPRARLNLLRAAERCRASAEGQSHPASASSSPSAATDTPS
jgi:tRNA 2-thiocytidine biosynthesis protein TtcA